MQAVWDFWANYYNKLWVQKYSLKPSRDKVIDIIKKTKIKNGDLLDMGCGTGQLLEDIYKEFGKDFDLCGADYSENMIKQALRNLKINNIEAELIHTDVCDIKEKICRKFDVITCTHSLPFYENKEKALSDMADLLKEKGCIIVVCGLENGFKDRFGCGIFKIMTGAPHYPNLKEYRGFAGDKLKFMGACRINKALFIPSIVAVVYKKHPVQ